MAWVAVDKDGTESIFEYAPIGRYKNYWDSYGDRDVVLPKGSIEKLIGRKLTWDDEPVELK